MLSLTQQVGSQIFGISTVVSDNKNFARTGQHIDIHMADYCLFSKSYKDIARASDFFYLGHSSSAKGQCSNSLRATHFIDFGYANQACRYQNIGVYLAVLSGRHGHNNAGHASHLRRAGVHHDGRRIGSGAAGHVNAHGIHRSDLLAQHGAEGTVGEPGFGHLLLVEFHHIGNSTLQRSLNLGLTNSFGFSKFFFGNANIFGSELHSINQLGVVE